MKIKKTKKSDLAAKIMAYGATAAGLLAVAQPAEAAIVYSGSQNLSLNDSNSPVNVDLNSDGTDDFRFSNYSSDGWAQIISARNGSWIYGTNYSNNYDPINLSGGYSIKSALGSNRSWYSSYSSTLAGNRDGQMATLITPADI